MGVFALRNQDFFLNADRLNVILVLYFIQVFLFFIFYIFYIPSQASTIALIEGKVVEKNRAATILK